MSELSSHAMTAGEGAVAESLRIGGIAPFSTVDWPGKLACVAFLTGCPWRCPYCQNFLLWDDASVTSSWEELASLLERRRGLLDGAVFSGGEPLAQPGLLDAVRRVHDMGFEVGLHTGGSFPDRLEALLPYLSWVGFDVKAPWDAYDLTTRRSGSGVVARRSFELLVASGVDMEARTTWHPGLLTSDDLLTIARGLGRAGVRRWAVQAYRAQGTNGSLPDERVFEADVPEEAKAAVPEFEFRRA